MADGVLWLCDDRRFFHEWCYSIVVMAGGDSGIYRERRVRCLTVGV
ncbi:hypothetical protein APHMUC_0817 [Anaplasma phagocytophilum str. ApMUC09]|uniref:Uncharacterized protein n=1 Tax=Anaplasma phagocytophilum str. ApMUC09 TaxID=1359152 RepID=A0A0F3N950_ANAPH|nr:hypothetical protein APHMUC_0817 [Anaplasma phagocytophilum str. ApMUC09]SCV64271.1 hypothetical protein ANAPH2_00900 [Anaplasma phagocytophilum]